MVRVLTTHSFVHSPGSGGTTGGLALGVALSGLSARTKLHAFCACDDDEYFYREIDQLITNLGLGDRFKARVRKSISPRMRA